MHPEAQKRLIRFRHEFVAGFGPTFLVKSFVKLDVRAPCGCKTNCRIFGGSDDVLVWLHNHQREYNRAVHLLLVSNGLIKPFRRVLRRDFQADNGSLLVGYGFHGKITLKAYSRILLADFLKSRPNPDWV